MTKAPSIRNTILIYFYGALFLVFLILVVSFNMAARQRVVSGLKMQLESAEELAAEFTGMEKSQGNPQQRRQFQDMMHSRGQEQAVSLLFLNDRYELTLEPVDQSRGMQGGMMHGSPNRPGQSTQLAKEENSMPMGHNAYLESMAVYDYVTSTSYELPDFKVTSATIGGEKYFLKSSPFPTDGQMEYVLAFAGTSAHDRQLKSTMQILVLVMLPILLLTFFIVRYLSGRLARPISQLEGLSSSIGSGDFTGEDFGLREKELKDLNTSLNSTAKQLKEYDENQKIFFQNVSHELRTPLTNIRGYAEGIRYGVFDRESASQVILDESARLEKLVDDILYLSRLESGESLAEDPQKILLSELLYGAREEVAQMLKLNGKDIQVGLSDDQMILVYTEELSRALVNLMDNAIRYARHSIWLEGSVKGDQLKIIVSDDGPGLKAGSEEAIFHRFTKGLDGRHGIGLSIVAASVRHHGGTVTAGGRENGQGASFTIRIPLK